MKAMTTTMKRLHFTPTAKISVAAGVAGVLVLVQFVLLILGAYVSRSEADQAVASAFESVGDATEQRVDAFVLSIKDAADRLTTALENPDVTPELAQDLVTVEFTRTWSASSIAVTYADGSFFRVTDAADAQLEGVYVQASMEPWIEPVVVDQYVLTPAGQNSGQAATTLRGVGPGKERGQAAPRLEPAEDARGPCGARGEDRVERCACGVVVLQGRHSVP